MLTASDGAAPLLRRARPGDLPQMMALQNALSELQESMCALPRPANWRARLEQQLRSFLADRNAAIFVAEAQGQLIGMLVCTIRDTSHESAVPAVGHISDVYVLPQCRRLGIASGLVALALRFCAQRGISHMRLSTLPNDEPANGFWEHLGFRPAMVSRIAALDDVGNALRKRRRTD